MFSSYDIVGLVFASLIKACQIYCVELGMYLSGGMYSTVYYHLLMLSDPDLKMIEEPCFMPCMHAMQAATVISEKLIK